MTMQNRFQYSVPPPLATALTIQYTWLHCLRGIVEIDFRLHSMVAKMIFHPQIDPYTNPYDLPTIP